MGFDFPNAEFSSFPVYWIHVDLMRLLKSLWTIETNSPKQHLKIPFLLKGDTLHVCLHYKDQRINVV
jgi:hypothetical protein